MNDKAGFKRVAFSPAEFAELFGKSQTWGYRQIYAGKVNVITDHGRTLIPAAEVERILGSAGEYNGPTTDKQPLKKLKAKAPLTKDELKVLAPQVPNAWESYLARRHNSSGVAPAAAPTPVRKSGQSRSPSKTAMSRLMQKMKSPKPTGEDASA